VSKKRKSPALFELISKSRDKQVGLSTRVPDWMTHREPVEPTPPAPPTAPAAQRPQPARPAPSWKTATEATTTTLGYGTVLAGVVVMVLLLGGAFWLGRATAGGGGEPALAGTDLSEQPSVGQEAAEPAKSGSPARPSAPKRIRGKHYLIIQGLRGLGPEELAEARAIEAFCNEMGEPVTVGKYPGPNPQYVVWSLKGFDSTDSEEAIAFARTIEKLGKIYLSKHGKYDFRQRDSEGNFRPWWHTY